MAGHMQKPIAFNMTKPTYEQMHTNVHYHEDVAHNASAKSQCMCNELLWTYMAGFFVMALPHG